MHGYDLIGVAFVDALHFVSIADEKVARVFEAPQEFVEIVHNLSVADLHETSVRMSSDRSHVLDFDWDSGRTPPSCDSAAARSFKQGRHRS